LLLFAVAEFDFGGISAFSLNRISIIILLSSPSLSFAHATNVYAGIVFGRGVRGHQSFSQGPR
jgi:hypothetical protein